MGDKDYTKNNKWAVVAMNAIVFLLKTRCKMIIYLNLKTKIKGGRKNFHILHLTKALALRLLNKGEWGKF